MQKAGYYNGDFNKLLSRRRAWKWLGDNYETLIGHYQTIKGWAAFQAYIVEAWRELIDVAEKAEEE